MVLVKNWLFFRVFILGNIGENMFYSILEQKYAFQCYKHRKITKSKNWDFLKGLVHGFGQKLAIFPCFYFRHYMLEKVSLTIFKNENTPFKAIETRSWKSGKIDIFPKGLVHALCQNWPFFRLFVLGNIGQKNMFSDILEQINAFLSYKNNKLKK